MSNKASNIQNFLTRADKFKLMAKDIPTSTMDTVIVRANNEAIGFRFDCYYKEALHPQISKETFDATVRGAHKICETVWSTRKQEEEKVYNVNSKRVFMISILVLFISLIFMIVKVYGGISLGNWLVYVSLILMIVSGTTTLVLILVSMFTKPQFTDFETAIMAKLNFYFNVVNQKYLQKGMQWTIGDKFYWLELSVGRRN